MNEPPNGRRDADAPASGSASRDPDETNAERRFTRRTLLLSTSAGTVAGLVVGAAGGAGAAIAASGALSADSNGTPVPAAGRHQGGVERPSVPQQHCIVAVADLDTTTLQATLAELGEQVLRVTDPRHPFTELTPDGPGDLTVTVSLGAAALAATAYPSLADSVTLPAFAGDADLPDDRRGGGILISVNATDPVVLEPVLQSLTALIPGYRLRWSDLGFRGHADRGVARNPFGYHDGIIVPKTRDAFDADVWIADGPLARGSICVVRRFALDTDGFRALPQERRDAIIGRRQVTGEPLSGGERDDEADLLAKTPSGELLVPARSHVRAAHPSFTGSSLMLRRSYSYRASESDQGHLFIAFQADPQTFARTQLRLDETDDMMAFATPTATGAFAVLPGFTANRPLGSTLF